MKHIIFLSLLCLSLTQSNYPSFAEFVITFNKNYDEFQYEYRKGLYEARIASFANIDSYTPGVSHISDWSAQQIAALSGNNAVSHSSSLQKAQVSSIKKVSAPASLDWRDQNAVTPPKDQGSCGSCWAFASAAYAESRLILAGRYTKDNIDLSEQFILKCTKDSDCGGGYMEYAMQTARQVPLDERYTYEPSRIDSGICSESGISVASQSIDYYNLSDDQIITLLQKSPVGAAISSDNWSNYGSGVFSCSSTALLDHAILIVGYTDDYWIIKNQWGTDWGEDGYMRVTRNRTANANCLIGTALHIMNWENMSIVGLSIVLLILSMLF